MPCDICYFYGGLHEDDCPKKPRPKLVWRRNDNGKYFLTLVEKPRADDLPFEP